MISSSCRNITLCFCACWQMLETDLRKAQATVDKLSTECGLCHSCDLVAAREVQIAKEAWDKERERLMQSEKVLQPGRWQGAGETGPRHGLGVAVGAGLS